MADKAPKHAREMTSPEYTAAKREAVRYQPPPPDPDIRVLNAAEMTPAQYKMARAAIIKR